MWYLAGAGVGLRSGRQDVLGFTSRSLSARLYRKRNEVDSTHVTNKTHVPRRKRSLRRTATFSLRGKHDLVYGTAWHGTDTLNDGVASSPVALQPRDALLENERYPRAHVLLGDFHAVLVIPLAPLRHPHAVPAGQVEGMATARVVQGLAQGELPGVSHADHRCILRPDRPDVGVRVVTHGARPVHSSVGGWSRRATWRGGSREGLVHPRAKERKGSRSRRRSVRRACLCRCCY